MADPIANPRAEEESPLSGATMDGGATRIILLPTRALQRLEAKMAEQGVPLRLVRQPGPWTPERIAHELVPFRDQLVARLPRELAAARDLSFDQRELVIDDAIDYMVTQHAKPIATREELERAFWASASYRVKRTHEGRGATVRAGWHRVDLEDLE